jgi:toxin FitB
VTGSKGIRRTSAESVVEEGTDQKDKAGNESHPVQNAQGMTDHQSRQLPGWQDRERGLGNHRKEDQTANPGDQRKKHEKRKKRHAEDYDLMRRESQQSQERQERTNGQPVAIGPAQAWLNKQEEEQLFLSGVTMGELQAGIERTRRQDPAKAMEIESWADQVAASYQILPMDTPCFREWGRIMDRKPDRLLEDAMIAATARVHQLIVATRNEGDFTQLDVQILNPFKAS